MAEHIGKYIVLKTLGHGAFGQVVEARDPDLQKSVAIKKLKARTRTDGPEVDSKLLFTKEAIDTGKLAHPNIVTVHGFGTDETDGAPYLVMEFIEGQTLQSFIRTAGPSTPLVQKLDIVQQVAEGLQFAHTRGVRHRDIKPANIMLLEDGTAKVLDFAVAPEGYVVGTPAYMAPEQFQGHGSDVLTDVFSYGAVYYELLTGRAAFDPQTKERHQKSSYEPPRVSTMIPECPPWLDDVVSRLMAKRREERVESLEEMLLYTRPILQRLKQQFAEQLAGGIAELLKSGNKEAADRLIERVLRLDPLNRQARDARGDMRAGQRERLRAKARELLLLAQAHFNSGDFEAALRGAEEAHNIDAGVDEIEKLLEQSRRKAEDQRMADVLVDEVIADIIDAGPKGMVSFQIEAAVSKLNRAANLDPRCRDAMELRARLLPIYEDLSVRKLRAATGAPGQINELFERRLKEARVARRTARSKDQFDYAEVILRSLSGFESDDRVLGELGAVIWDRTAFLTSQDVLNRAMRVYNAGDPLGALKVVYEFADQYPRAAFRVQDLRRKWEKELEAREKTDESS